MYIHIYIYIYIERGIYLYMYIYKGRGCLVRGRAMEPPLEPHQRLSLHRMDSSQPQIMCISIYIYVHMYINISIYTDEISVSKSI